MKTSLRRLRGFALHKHHNDGTEFRTNNLPRPLAQLDELSQATQDMEDMRDCYDTLLSAAAATANSAYEFSESLREMGACLLEKTALNDDEDSGKVLLMLGKLQFELQKLVDNYRSHIFQTITTPSESLLNELRIVEEMKQQCDEKRKEYEKKIAERSRSAKGGTISSQELQVAHDEYEVEATLFIFRLKSLKQGQSRSLLTQAARHHASQLSFFRKSLKALEAVEPHVKLVTEQQHIDYQFSGLDDDDNESDNESDDDSYDAYDDGELSFDYGQNEQGQEVDATVTNLMEVDQGGLTFPQLTSVEVAKENLDKNRGDGFLLSGEFRAGSQSAPLLAMKKVDPNETLMRMRTSSTRKLHTYVLPTPNDTNNSVYSGSGYPGLHTRDTNNLWHSTPLEQKKAETFLGNEKFFGPNLPKAESVLKDSNKNTESIRLPPPLPDLHSNSDAKKIKRQAFSGPLTSKAWSSKPLSISGPLVPEFKPQLFSGPLIRTPVPLPPSSSPPKKSELHELPRPPTGLPSKYATRGSGLVGHSAPLVSRGGQDVLHAANRRRVSIAASPLPTPPQYVTRSFSTPSSSPRVNNMFASKNSRAFQSSILAEDVGSPPLTPISLPNASTTQTGTRETQNQGAD